VALIEAELRLGWFENRELRRTFGTKKDEIKRGVEKTTQQEV
jgi:hypothetical protein